MITAFGSSDDEAYAVAIQKNGKIVVAGYSDNGSYDVFALARYKTDGTLDSTFGTNGRDTTAFGYSNAIAYAVAIQSDGTLNDFAFDGSDGRVASTAPFGFGTSDSTTNFTSGTATLGTVSLTTTDGFDNPVGLFATQITASPNSLPNSSPTMLSDRYWVINAFGTPGTFSTNPTFTVPSSFTSNGSASMSSFTLYKRSSTSDGDWTMLINGASAMTSTTVTFDGITSFSEFSLGQGALLPIRMASLAATAAENTVKLEWTTISETNNYGFYVERKPQNSST